MTYEVELKFPLRDGSRVLALLRELGAQEQPLVRQADRYFAHPSRDFAQTDEALRIRSIVRADVTAENRVTYKGPVVDARAKTRREIEIPFGEVAGDGERFAEILTLLGFREVRTVAKERVPYHLTWEDRALELAYDDVAGLGTFLEIEATADEAGRDAARDSILRLAERLGLANSERRSYLVMLLERDGLGERGASAP